MLAPTLLPQSVKGRKDKTDEKDALRILEALRGHLLAGNRLPTVWVPDRTMREDREIVRSRLDVDREARRERVLFEMIQYPQQRIRRTHKTEHILPTPMCSARDQPPEGGKH